MLEGEPAERLKRELDVSHNGREYDVLYISQSITNLESLKTCSFCRAFSFAASSSVQMEINYALLFVPGLGA